MFQIKASKQLQLKGMFPNLFSEVFSPSPHLTALTLEFNKAATTSWWPFMDPLASGISTWGKGSNQPTNQPTNQPKHKIKKTNPKQMSVDLSLKNKLHWYYDITWHDMICDASSLSLHIYIYIWCYVFFRGCCFFGTWPMGKCACLPRIFLLEGPSLEKVDGRWSTEVPCQCFLRSLPSMELLTTSKW